MTDLWREWYAAHPEIRRVNKPNLRQDPYCRSCWADVEWVRTEKGKMMPLDTEPNPAGRFVFREEVYQLRDKGGNRIVHYLRDGELEINERATYESHFATCIGKERPVASGSEAELTL